MAEITFYDEDEDGGQYPCSCGHCSECGRNFVATPEEERRWAEEDADYYGQWRLE